MRGSSNRSASCDGRHHVILRPITLPRPAQPDMAYNPFMHALSSVFSLLVAAAGWYYMFYSRAASRLSGIEDEDANRKRHRLRQINGFVMFLLAIGVYAGLNSIDPAASQSAAAAFLAVWLTVFLLLLIIVLLAMVDLRLTWRLRHRRRH